MDLNPEFLLALIQQLTNKACWSWVLWVSQHNQEPNRSCKNLNRGTKAFAWSKRQAFRAFSFQVCDHQRFSASKTDCCACHKILKLKNTENCKDLVGLMMRSSHCCTLMYFRLGKYTNLWSWLYQLMRKFEPI